MTFYIYSSCSFIFQENAKLLNFGYDDVIIHEGDPPGGIYIIVSGMVRVSLKLALRNHTPFFLRESFEMNLVKTEFSAIALRMTKTQWSFGRFECNRGKVY